MKRELAILPRGASRAIPEPSSHPLPVHGEIFEDVLLSRSGKAPKKTFSSQFHDPRKQTRPRNDGTPPIDAERWHAMTTQERAKARQKAHWRFALARHPRARKAQPPRPPEARGWTAEAPPILSIDNAPLALRVPMLRNALCARCLLAVHGLVTSAPVPASFISHFKDESTFVEPAKLPDLLA